MHTRIGGNPQKWTKSKLAPKTTACDRLNFPAELDLRALSALTLLVGQQEDIQPVKTEWWSGGMVICLEQGADLLMPLPLTVSCFSKIHIGYTFLVPAYLVSPRQRAVKRVCVCVWVGLRIVQLGRKPQNWQSSS